MQLIMNTPAQRSVALYLSRDMAHLSNHAVDYTEQTNLGNTHARMHARTHAHTHTHTQISGFLCRVLTAKDAH